MQFGVAELGIGGEGALDLLGEAVEDVADDPLAVDEHGQGLTHAPILKERALLVVADVAVRHRRVAVFFERAGLEDRGVGVAHPLVGGEVEHVDAARRERHEAGARELDDFEGAA